MLTETQIGLIIVGVLTLISSLTTLTISNYFNYKQWTKKKKVEESRKAVGQVYSPLFFILSEVAHKLGYYAGNFNSALEWGLSNERTKKRFFEWSNSEKEEKISLELINIIKTKGDLINPKDFWKDLFYYTIYFKDLEEEIQLFDEIAFKRKNIPILQKRFENLCQATVELMKIANVFVKTLEELIDQEGILKNEYERVMEKEVIQAIRHLIYKPWQDETKQSYSKFTKKYLK